VVELLDADQRSGHTSKLHLTSLPASSLPDSVMMEMVIRRRHPLPNFISYLEDGPLLNDVQ
jgi:hypothetical protein